MPICWVKKKKEDFLWEQNRTESFTQGPFTETTNREKVNGRKKGEEEEGGERQRKTMLITDIDKRYKIEHVGIKEVQSWKDVYRE